MNIDVKSLKKFQQIDFNSPLKRSYTMIKSGVSEECNISSPYKNQSI